MPFRAHSAEPSASGLASRGVEFDHYRGGAAEPLVLVHGIRHTWRGWKPMLPLLGPRFDVLAVDLPGFGHSPPLPSGTDPTPEALADAVEGAMDQAGLERALVCGISLGGWIALELARRGRASAVVAISPAGLQHARDRAREGTCCSECTGRPAARRRPSRYCGPAWAASCSPAPRWPALGSSTPATSPRPPVRGRPGVSRHAPPHVRWTGEGPDRDRRTGPAPVGRRNLILLPRQAKRFERLIPNAELRYLKGLGHTPMSDDPELLVELVVTKSSAPRAEVPA